MKKCLSLLLALCLLLSACSLALAEEAKLPISEGTYPIVPEGEEVTLKIGVIKHATWGGEPEKQWLWNYLSKLMNIKFEFTTVLDSALTERKNLMFAADDLPDVLIGYNLTPAEMVTYGQVDGQLLALNDYINEEYMPNLMQWLESMPEFWGMMACPNGSIYSLPRINKEMNAGDSANIHAMYINQAWLDENGKSRPTTLDELTALLREYKAMNPDFYPFAACASGTTGLGLLLNALGYLCGRDNIYGSTVTLRNGEVTIPCYDDLFVEYLKVVKTWLDEGLISPDYFTMDKSAVFAAVGENKALIFCGQPYVANAAYESFSRWSALTPLTSQWNDTPVARTTVQSKVGGFVVSSKAQHVDVIMKMADWFFSGLGGFYQWYGPQAGDEEMIMGMENVMGWVVDENGVGSFEAVNKGVAASNAAYLLGNIVSNWVVFGNNSHWLGREDEGLISMASVRQYLGGYNTPKGFNLDPTLGFASASLTASQYVLPYIQYDYPAIVYMDEETTLAIADLTSVLNSYIEQEAAKFMTGRRDLSEFDAFRGELKNLGIEELLGYYKTAYEAYQKNSAAE